jgi:putative membrane protein
MSSILDRGAMMRWFGGDGWGWCGLIFSGLAMAVFWGAVFTAILLAVHLLSRERNNPSAIAVAGSTRAQGVTPARVARGEMGNDDFYRRLM